jgi:signal transduction histidine kinase
VNAASKSNEDKLRAQYAEIAALAGQLAHEIKNPLSTISLNVELLAEDYAAPETPRERRAAERVARVQRECRRLQELLNDFLNFARAQPRQMEECDLNQLLEELLAFYRPQAQEAKIEVVPLLDRNLPSVRIDREQIRAALLNLVLNAQQAMPNGGQLEIRTRALASGGRQPSGPPALALDLIDTGVGMDQKTLDRIFETFYSTKPGGSGLGLPTTRKIIETHGGKITVQSEPGRGTQFTIELPVSGPWSVVPANVEKKEASKPSRR